MKILGDMTAKSPRNIRVFQYLRRMGSMALLNAIISIFLETVVPYVRPQLQPVEKSSAVDKKPGTGGGEPETAGASGRKLLASLLGTSPPSKRGQIRTSTLKFLINTLESSPFVLLYNTISSS